MLDAISKTSALMGIISHFRFLNAERGFSSLLKLGVMNSESILWSSGRMTCVVATDEASLEGTKGTGSTK